MWNSGSTARIRSRSWNPSNASAPLIWQRFATTLRCVNITPFGSPVVPLEYGSTTTSSDGVIETDGGVGGASSSSSNGRTQSASSPNMYSVSTPAAAAASFALSRYGGAVTI